MVIKGLVYDIQRYSVNDGPGIRTTVFLKGCPLRCLWCANPESQEPFPQLLYSEQLCVRCYRCVDACPTGATIINQDGSIKIERDRCQACGKCVEACLNEARAISGKYMTVNEVLEVVKSDMLFYRNSGGGVTASGGEPTSQPEFVLELFKKCHECGIDTALDTCGYVSWEVLENILEYTDLVLFDIKHMEPGRHRELTAVNNKLILENIAKIARRGTPVIVRVPLIPMHNDSMENIRTLGKFVSELGLTRVDLVPYHQLGQSKYKRMGKKYSLEGVKPPSESDVQAIQELLESYKAEVTIA